MADRDVLAEINLTSNEMILGISGNRHPFATYRKFGVPVALTTDDPGIERIELTDEFVRAVSDYALTYAEIKDIVRNSLEYSFLPGSSLWAKKGDYSRHTSVPKAFAETGTK
jgi:adenosine deaminase